MVLLPDCHSGYDPNRFSTSVRATVRFGSSRAFAAVCLARALRTFLITVRQPIEFSTLRVAPCIGAIY